MPLLVLLSACSILFEASPGGVVDGGRVDGDGTAIGEDGASEADADPSAPDSCASVCSLGSMATLTLNVHTTTGAGQIALTSHGGLFCNEARSPCEFEIPCLDPVRLYASPNDFGDWLPDQNSPCPYNVNQNTLTLTMASNCTIAAYFGEAPF